MQNNKTTVRNVALALALLGAGLFALSNRSTGPQGGPVGVMAGLDASQSVRARSGEGAPLLGAGVNLVAQIGETLDPARITVFRVDWQTQEFYDASAPRDPEAFHHTIIERMKPLPTKSGTYPALFWAEAARRAQDAPHPGRHLLGFGCR